MADVGDFEVSLVEKGSPQYLDRATRLLADVLWALDEALRSHDARKAMDRTSYGQSIALAILGALLVHAALRGL